MVIRYEGPKGGPGGEKCSQQLLQSIKVWDKSCSYNRWKVFGSNQVLCRSRESRSCCFSPIALVEDGDEIILDGKKLIELCVPDQELRHRKKNKKLKKMILQLVLCGSFQSVGSARYGAVLIPVKRKFIRYITNLQYL